MTPKYSRKLRVTITVFLGYCCMLSGNLGTAENEWDLTTIELHLSLNSLFSYVMEPVLLSNLFFLDCPEEGDSKHLRNFGNKLPANTA